MGLFRRREKALTADGGALQAINDPGFNAFPLLGGGAQQRIQNAFNRAQGASYGWMYAHSPAVRTVIDVIVRNVGQLELRLYEEVGEAERQPRPDHPAALSLRYPNEQTTSDKLIRSLFKDFLIYDNAYAILAPAPGNQVRFTRLPAYMVEVQGPSLFEVSNYRAWPQGAWTTAGTWGGFGTPIDFAPQEILHWHGEHPLDPRIGVSHLDSLRDVIAEDAALQQATVELAQSGLQEPVWVSRPLDAPEWSPEAAVGFEEDITNRIRRRTRKVPLLEEGMRLESFGVSPQDAQMLEARRYAVERVATEYGVPLAIVGLGSGRAENLQDAQAQLYTDTLLPYGEDFTKMLNLRILVRVYDWTDGTFEFSFDEKLMGNDRLRAFVTATGRSVMLTNEARAKLNLPPVPGGDELVTPANVLVGDNPLPSVGVMPVQDPNGPAQDGSYRSDQGSATEPPKALAKAADFTPLPRLHPSSAAELERQHRHTDTMQGVVQKHFNRLERGLRGRGVSDWARWDREFATDLDTALKSVVQAEGDTYSMKLAGGNFDMGRVQDYLKAMAEGAAQGINDKIRAQIDEMGVDEAVKRLPQHVASAGASLGAHSTQWARKEAAKQAPDFAQRVQRWIADSGRHAEFDGQTVPVGADWPAGFAPGGVPGCQCTSAIY